MVKQQNKSIESKALYLAYNITTGLRQLEHCKQKKKKKLLTEIMSMHAPLNLAEVCLCHYRRGPFEPFRLEKLNTGCRNFLRRTLHISCLLNEL